MEQGELTSQQLLEHLLGRIDQHNERGAGLRAIVEINPDAMALARQFDAERAAGKVRGPLHGIPVVLKDNIGTADRLQTAAGSLALVGPPAPGDAAVVVNLRAAGALVLGKSNMSEWANFRGSNIPNGWSGRGGHTLSPYGAEFDACGSSTGSAVALAAGFVPAAVGTETTGSIICPAANNGVVGIKPTLGLLSNLGIVPLSARQDTPGPMARNVTDAAVLLAGMQSDPALLGQYLVAINSANLRGKRIGVPAEYAEGVGLVNDNPLFAQALAAMRRAGAQLIPVSPRVAPSYDEMYVLLHEFKAAIPVYLQSRPGLGVGSLSDVIRFNGSHPGHPDYNQFWLETAQAWEMSEEDYAQTLERMVRLNRTALDTPFAQHNLHALAFPAAFSSWSMAARAGYPNITVPAGLSEQGLPGGISFVGQANSETQLLALAAAYEALVPPSTCVSR